MRREMDENVYGCDSGATADFGSPPREVPAGSPNSDVYGVAQKNEKCGGFHLSPVFCIHNKVCIVEASENSEAVTVGMCNTDDYQLQNHIRRVFDISEPKGRNLEFVKITEDFCRRSIARMLADAGYRKPFSGSAENDTAEKHEQTSSFLSEENADVPAVNLIDSVIIEALTDNVSDIHFEPCSFADGTKKLLIRFRKDGCLVLYKSTDFSLLEPVIVRIKMLAGLRAEESRRPQDGRFIWKNAGLSADIRVSVIPLWNGESAVLRLLRTAVAHVKLEELGFSETHVRTLHNILSQRNSLVLVAGPTGAGKTTTLAGMVSYLASDGASNCAAGVTTQCAEASAVAPTGAASRTAAAQSTAAVRSAASGRKKIITIEDPVEYRIPGVTQIEVRPGINFDFGDALRHVFRHDPDVLMIGEIRDGKTAATAVRAAVTGHLVLATVHASSASAAVIRLLDMGIEPYLLASVFGAAVAQSLVSAAAGGRTVVAEILSGTEEVRKLIAAKAPVSAFASCMHSQGMVSLREDFDAKKALGIIAGTEVFNG